MLADVFVPLLTYPDATSQDAVRRTIDFVQPFARTINLCVFEVDLPSVVYTGLTAEIYGVSELIAAAEAQSRKVGEALRAFAASTPSNAAVFVASVRCAEDQINHAAARAARTHDLAVVALDPQNPGQRRVAESLVFGGGGPVLLLPGNAAKHDLAHVAIAWDGSSAASRAVHDALPFITQAKQVSIFTALDDKEIASQSIQALSLYLERHGIRGRHEDVKAAGLSVGSALQDAAYRNGAGLLVMGAFGHSRLRDFILGGATRSVLDELRLPVLLSH